jgi:hypothetical protein
VSAAGVRRVWLAPGRYGRDRNRAALTLTCRTSPEGRRLYIAATWQSPKTRWPGATTEIT